MNKEERENYFRGFSVSELEQMIREDIEGIKELSVENIMIICEILVQKNNIHTDVKASWKSFRNQYIEGKYE